VNAVKLQKKKENAVKDPCRCIGCGVCIPTCERHTIRLKKRKEEVVPPKEDDDLYDTIMANRGGTLLSLVRVFQTLLKNPRK
jgi:ferredoxin